MKAKYFFLLSIALVGLAAQSAFGQNDFRIKQRMTMAGQSFDSAVMIKGSRQRSESNMMGMQNVSIMQCDLKRTIDISELEKKYVVTPMDLPLPSEPARRVSTTTTRQPVQAGGTVTQTIELIDTGERKQMFGMTARHIKTIMTTEPSPDACQKGSQRIETDGWYVDLAFGLSCQNDRPVTMPMQTDGGGGCRDKMNMVRKGNAKLGYPLIQTTKIGMGGAGETTMTTEVLELSKATLSPDLFDIPAGFTEASSRQELYGSATQQAMSQYSRAAQPDNEVTRRAPGSVNTKRPGVMRVGVLPVTNSTPRNLSLETYRNNLLAAIVGGNVEAVAINSESDAQRLNCDYVLSTNVKEMKQSAASKVGGLFGKVTGSSTGGLAKVESVVSYSLKKMSGGPVLTAEATAKVEGDDNSVIASLTSEADAVRSFIAKGR